MLSNILWRLLDAEDIFGDGSSPSAVSSKNRIEIKGGHELENKERYLTLCRSVKREGIEDLLQWLETSDFYTAPASTRFHGNYPGGLLEHSLNVYDELVRLLEAYPEVVVPQESVVVASLFHDLCKINFYAPEKRNRKNEFGKWESYDAYTVKENFCYGGHGSKSVFLVQYFMRLTPEEAVAIHCHMGAFSENPQDVYRAYEQCPFAFLLHMADSAATIIKETKEA